MSRHHVHISACIALQFHRQPHSDTGKIFARFPTHASFLNIRASKLKLIPAMLWLFRAPLFRPRRFIPPPFSVGTASVNSSMVSALGSLSAVQGIKPRLSIPPLSLSLSRSLYLSLPPLSLSLSLSHSVSPRARLLVVGMLRFNSQT